MGLNFKTLWRKLEVKFPGLKTFFAGETASVLQGVSLPKELLRRVNSYKRNEDGEIPDESNLVTRIEEYKLTAAQIDILLILLEENGCFNDDPTYGTPISHGRLNLFEETNFPTDVAERQKILSDLRKNTWMCIFHAFTSKESFPEIVNSPEDANLFGTVGVGFSDMRWNIVVVNASEQLFATYMELGHTFLLIGKRLNELSETQKKSIITTLKEMILACRKHRKTTREDTFRQEFLGDYLGKFNAIIDVSPEGK